jgi:hypothetical protein
MIAKLMRWSGVALVLLSVAIQFVRPAKTNPVVNPATTIEAHAQVPSEVTAILQRSCGDCHSHQTRWPWYSQVAPVSWFVIDHVNHGRKHLNLSDWARYNRREAEELLDGICKTTKTGLMPLSSYLLLHRDAKLSQADVKALCEWTDTERQRLAYRSASPR